MKNQIAFSLVVCSALLGLGGCASTGEDPPMPQTRGMQGMDPKMHDAASPPMVTCVPNARAAGMAHAPADHPMPDTRGMHGMDPALHMQDCHGPASEPVQLGPHQHKTPGN